MMAPSGPGDSRRPSTETWKLSVVIVTSIAWPRKLRPRTLMLLAATG
jgi:hypothetical protein